ncbi:hypothetical protein [Sphingomonas aracearum]|uniref:Uncharacterized protein n=1 Tax=Sphingomonas aracearum TaxID=2283317 RepID=A0A369VQZ1_9SPHN|nr:hypothetical protein [Sphingomonas aracearum]RDE04806.1 hypothetical protein DVW87_14620 [Sphingomonas aracearum]
MSGAVERIGEQAERRGAGRVAAAVRGAVPGATVREEGSRVVIEGRGVLDEPALRWIGSLVR